MHHSVRHAVIVCGILLAMAVLIQCGSDSDDGTPSCSFPIQDFVGGTTSFTVEDIEDECTGGLIEDLIDQYDPTYPGPYPPVNIPGYAILQNGYSMTIDLPLIGPVDVDLSISGNAIALHIPEQAYTFTPCTFIIEVSGKLVPCSSTKVTYGTITFTVTQISGGVQCGQGVVPTPCTVSFSVSGS